MRTSELMQALSEAGAPMEAILIAVRALEEKENEIAMRKAGDRERKRRQRARAQDTDGTFAGQSQDTDGTVTDNNAPPLSRPLPPQTPLTPTHTPGYNKPARVKGGLAKPEDVSPQVWTDFQRHRKAKRADLSETALAGIRREAGKAGWSMDAALAECIARGWTGFKSEWVTGAAAAAASPCDDPLMSRIMARKSGV